MNSNAPIKRNLRAGFSPLLLASIMAILLLPAVATAHQERIFTPFGPPELSGPGALAIDQSSGDVYVADTANQRIVKFDSEGHFLLTFGDGVDATTGEDICTAASGDTCGPGTSGTAPGQFSFTNFAPQVNAFLAVDNSGGPSTGDVYVADPGAQLVSKFDPSGHLITDWASGGQLDGSTNPDGPFAPYIAGVAANPAGTLFVACVCIGSPAEDSIFAFDESGASLGSFHPPGDLQRRGLAADPAGNIFVGTSVSSEGVVEKLTSEGADIGAVSSGSLALAVDPASGDLFTGTGQPSQVEHFAFNGSGEVIELGGGTCSLTPGSTCGPTSSFQLPFQFFSGIAVSPSANDIYLSHGTDNHVYRSRVVTFADATTGQADAIESTTATVHGTVNPDSVAVTDCRFEYGTDTTYSHSAPCAEPVGAGSAPVSVHADLTNLQPDREYHFRLAAENAQVTAFGEDSTFETTGPPLIAAEPADHQSPTSAMLHAALNPHGFETTYHFEYGTSTSYDAVTATQSLGPTPGFTLVDAPVEGLLPETTYHFRIVAGNAQGSQPGSDFSFTTPSASCPNKSLRTGLSARLPDCRAFEKITPNDKAGNPARGTAISADGRHVTFEIAGGGLPSDASVEVFNAYAAERDLDGWKILSITPPSPPGSIFSGFKFESTDLTRFFGRLNVAPNKGGAANVRKAYYFLEEGDRILSKLEVNDLGQWSGENEQGLIEGDPVRFTASSDLSRIFLTSGYSLLPADVVPSKTSEALYEIAGLDTEAPQLRLLLPRDGAIVDGVTVNRCATGPINRPDMGTLASDSGDYVFFKTGILKGGQCNEELLAATDSGIVNVGLPSPNDQCTTSNCQAFLGNVSKMGSQTAILGHSQDGKRVFFITGRQLTNDAVDLAGGLNNECWHYRGCNLYEYNFSQPLGHRLRVLSSGDISGQGPGVRTAMRVPADGPHVYFTSHGVLSQDANEMGQVAKAGAENLYVIDTGSLEKHFITDLCSGEDLSGEAEDPACAGPGVDYVTISDLSQIYSDATPDGRVLVFSSYGQLTPDDSNASRDVYRYDAQNNSLVRVSVGHDGEDSNGNGGGQDAEARPRSRVSISADNLEGHIVSDDGQTIVFETSRPLQSTAETNQPEAYEWNQGEVSLISGGNSGGTRQPGVQINGSGQDILFDSDQGLVSEDIDGIGDVYDARRDGGFPPQPPPPPICEGPEGCGRTSGGEPQQPSLGTETFQGPGNQHESPCRKGFRRRKGKCHRIHHHRRRHRHHRRHVNAQPREGR